MITKTTLDALCEAVTRYGLSEAGIGELRAHFSDLYLQFCLDDEMGSAEPYRSYAHFSLYLIHCGGHCLGLTDDPSCAFGVLLAEVEAQS